MSDESANEMATRMGKHSDIDQEVFTWVMEHKRKSKQPITPNTIRQKAYEVGQQCDPNFKASINWYINWKKRTGYQESEEDEVAKRRKRSYTAGFKLEAVRRCQELENASQAALELNVSRRCLQRWKEELDIISTVANESGSAIFRRPGQGRKVSNPQLDKALFEWVKESWEQGITLNTNQIREKARELNGSPSFKASLGWFVKWQKRYNINLRDHTFDDPHEKKELELKLKILPEGEASSSGTFYSPTIFTSPRRKPKKKKKKVEEETELVGENDEDFDQFLLEWLIERWQHDEVISNREVREKALEMSTNPDFRASKSWLSHWKKKHHISLQRRTYGEASGTNDGTEELDSDQEEDMENGDNLLLPSRNLVVTTTTITAPLVSAQQTSTVSSALVSQAQQQLQMVANTSLSPITQEAATALASLSAEDHEAGLEIAQALQHLADALSTDPSTSKETQLANLQQAMQIASLQQTLQLAAQQQQQVGSVQQAAQLASLGVTSAVAPQGSQLSYSQPEVLLSSEQIALEEEIVTDESMVVYETTTVSQEDIQTVDVTTDVLPTTSGQQEVTVVQESSLTSTAPTEQLTIVPEQAVTEEIVSTEVLEMEEVPIEGTNMEVISTELLVEPNEPITITNDQTTTIVTVTSS